MRLGRFTSAFFFGAVVSVFIGPAQSGETCAEIATLVARAEQGFVQEPGVDFSGPLSGAKDCGLTENLDETRGFHCMWEHAYRQPAALDQFERMVRSLRNCLEVDVEELHDQPVNHPDFYDQISFQVGSVTIAVSIKDKSALQKTFTFLRIQTKNR